WVGEYLNQTIQVPNGPSITVDETTVKRAAVRYGKAIAHALSLAAYIKQAAEKRGQEHEIELSVDETPQPTTLAEHYIIADQCRRAPGSPGSHGAPGGPGGMNFVSLAPRYVGDFEKGLDYKG